MKELNQIEKTFFLKQHPLFEELDLDLLLAIADKMIPDIYDANEKVFAKDQIANRMYLIFDGKVEITDIETPNQKPIILKSPQFFGEEALFNDRPRLYSATCIEDTTFLTLPRTNLLTIISECPSVAVALLACYAKAFGCRHVH